MKVINLTKKDMETILPLKDQIDAYDVTIENLSNKLLIAKKMLWSVIFEKYPEADKNNCTILYDANKLLVMDKTDELALLQEKYGKEAGQIAFNIRNPTEDP